MQGFWVRCARRGEEGERGPITGQERAEGSNSNAFSYSPALSKFQYVQNLELTSSGHKKRGIKLTPCQLKSLARTQAHDS